MRCQAKDPQAARPAKRAKVIAESDDEDEGDSGMHHDDDDEDDDWLDSSSSDDDDDLFDMEELEEISRSTKRTDGLGAKEKDKGGGGKAARAGRLGKGKSALDEDEEGLSGGDESENDSEHGEAGRRGQGKRRSVGTVAGSRSKKVNRLSEVEAAAESGEEEESGSGAEGYDEGYDSDAVAARKRKRAAAGRQREAAQREAEEDDSPPADLNDYLRLQTRRVFVEKWLNEPYFDDVVRGSYVRFQIGQHEGVPVYRMTEVLDIIDSKRPYKMPGSNISVDKMLVLGLGKYQKTGRLEKVSNSRITPSEFAHYCTQLKDSRMEGKLLTKKVTPRSGWK